MIIPNINLRLCSIIDGQHRLLGFKYAKNKDIQLPCSIYNSLPPSNQATIFSTINFNQQKVPKSLAYRLFGYSLDDISESIGLLICLLYILVRNSIKQMNILSTDD
ncbi:DGQHR domain-containing protein [Escherichia coli]|uniref:DGQHR domain-containing protein n=1 Tax=Escherichia coli TaxID=562 RepID=UPI001BCACEDB|nr:DGQHR domain-containing protein [Escherichia coli]MBS4285257.1 DGQHR domain-containing protein [Escherichia coli]MBS4289903.1 DGQHR domain-containing protein [Escherichia coli]